MSTLEIVAGLYLLAYFTYIHFAALMRLRDVYKAKLLTPEAAIFALPALVLGYALDVLLNIASCFLLLDFPFEPLFSNKLTRLIAEEPGGWRGRVALRIRKGFLDNVDPRGVHR